MPHTIKRTVVRNLSFAQIFLPPFQDILVLGKKVSLGGIGILDSLERLAPNTFKFIKLESPNTIEGVFISKSLLVKIPQEIIMNDLEEVVFSSVIGTEMIKVDYDYSIKVSNLETEI